MDLAVLYACYILSTNQLDLWHNGYASRLTCWRPRFDPGWKCIYIFFLIYFIYFFLLFLVCNLWWSDGTVNLSVSDRPTSWCQGMNLLCWPLDFPHVSFYIMPSFKIVFWDRMWNSIVSVADHCLFIYFVTSRERTIYPPVINFGRKQSDTGKTVVYLSTQHFAGKLFCRFYNV